MSKDSSSIRAGSGTWRLCAVACAAAAVFAAGAADAQTGRATPPPAVHFAMVKQSLSKALSSVAQQTGSEIIFDPATVKGFTAPELNGDLTVEQALERLLEGTKLTFRRTDKGVYLIQAPARTERQSEAEPIEGLPEIIVRGKRSWSLNTGIARTEDDTQPYIVFDQAQIQRSGATSLEEFFRDHLTVDSSAGTSAQGTGTGQGLSRVNLRGLGANETLILIDGRRIAGANNPFDAGAGQLGQTQINGIPLESIERIEVLASSASGIYGSNAAGGVINIILRRDYKGLNATVSYGGTFNGGGSNRRLDLSGATSLEDGRTSLSFFGSISDIDPLLMGQRDLQLRGRQHLLSVNPNYYTTGAGRDGVILGATPNIRSTNGSNLVLKNGTSLGSPITYLPDGYTTANGTAPLIANAGKYNLDLAPTAAGAGAPLLLGQKIKSGSLAVRREFTPWLIAYGQISGSVTEMVSPRSRVPDAFVLLPSAPNNPFNQSISVSAPAIGGDASNLSTSRSLNTVLGATVKLPFEWQAILDASDSRSRYWADNDGGPIDVATNLGILNGSIDILRDRRQSPIAYGYLDPSVGNGTTPSRSGGRTLSLRLAGPLPVELPGGKPALTLLAEHSRLSTDGLTSIYNWTPSVAPPAGVTNVSGLTAAGLTSAVGARINYIPPRARVTQSVYGEVRLPIVGEKNNIPFVQSLEAQIAGRQDEYDEKATVTRLASGQVLNDAFCVGVMRPLQPADLAVACPPATTTFETNSSKRRTFNPSVSLRWQVQSDVALRASYATGFVPPMLNQLSRNVPLVLQTQLLYQFGFQAFSARDPLRGNELIGSKTPTVSYATGGNPDVLPETSKTTSAGIILTPRFLPDLRLAVDWTHIVQKDNYFSPDKLLNVRVPTPTIQAQFNAFLQAHPERFTRGPASDGFTAGPITVIDGSIANILGSKTDAFDLAASYQISFPGSGTLDLSAKATYLKSLLVQTAPGAAPVQFAGYAGGDFASGLADNGGVRWKGNLAASWSTSDWSMGARARFFDAYFLDADHSLVNSAQGAASIPRQVYFDLYGSYKLPYDAELRMTANNVFNRKPPIDVTNGGAYSRLGDPRLGYYTLSLSKRF